ncbi:MAG: hypothetical protein LBL44_09355, partial [Treponema sp.]|nr:hypothetical protein [Treponema sp.]
RRAADILARALEEKDARDILCRELYPLLFPEKDPAGADLPELKDAVYALARRAAGNNHGR